MLLRGAFHWMHHPGGIVMNCSVLSVVSLMILLAVLAKCQAQQQARLSSCHTSKDPEGNDEVIDASAGTCEFNGNLCTYRQGCQDPLMSAWIPKADFAEVSAKFGSVNAYSVLESPLLRLTDISCVDIVYSVFAPLKMEVFLADADSDFRLPNNSGPSENGQPRTLSYTVPNITEAKLKFRAYGGGAASAGPSVVRLHSVQVNLGNCSDPGCSFDEPADFCGWIPDNFQHKNFLNSSGLTLKDLTAVGQFIVASDTAFKSTLTSTLTRPTKALSCLTFSFVVTGVGAILSVLIHSVRGESLTLWTYTATSFNDSSVWNHAYIPVRSCSAFKIKFESPPATDAPSVVAIDNVQYARNISPTSCSFTPRDAHRPYTPDIYSSFCEGGFTQTPDGADEGEETGDEVGAIVGSVVAVAVIIIILVVVGVVLWRRRRRDKDGSASDAGRVMAGRDADLPKDGAQISSLEETFDSGYSQVDPLPPSFNRVDGLAEDGEPRKRRRSNVTDEYNVLNAHGSRKNPQQPQDDYSHIQSQDFGPDASAMYSQVKKPKNNASTGFDAGVLYSQVQKKGKKPAGPQSATCGDDYNRIDFSAGAVGAPDGSRDTYNRLDKTT